MFSRLIPTILLGTSFLYASVFAQTAAPAPADLTLESCIARALQKNFSLEIQRYSPQIARDSIAIADSAYETQLTTTGAYSGESDRNSTTATSSHDSNLRVGVSQRLYTGTTVSASSRLDRSSVSPIGPSAALNPAYNADLALSVRQSLLSGFGTTVNKAAIRRASLGLDRANLDYQSAALNVIEDTENAYYAVAFTREQLAVRNFSYQLANRLFEEAKTRRDTGVATDLDVLQAQVGVANARRSVLLAEQAVKDRQDALLALIGQFELDQIVGTVRFPEAPDALPVFASSFAMAKQIQPDYLSTQASIEQIKLDLVVAKDGAKPDLSVGAAVGLNGRNGSGRNAFNDALDREDQTWQVDFTFSYPWGQKSDKARYRQALSSLSREQSRLRLAEQTIEVQVRSAVRSVETNQQSLEIATFASTLSEKQYELEKAKFDAGLSTSRRVLEAQNDLETARVSELQAKVNLRNAISALHRIEGSSLQRYRVSLP